MLYSQNCTKLISQRIIIKLLFIHRFIIDFHRRNIYIYIPLNHEKTFNPFNHLSLSRRKKIHIKTLFLRAFDLDQTCPKNESVHTLLLPTRKLDRSLKRSLPLPFFWAANWPAKWPAKS